jgi:hypothetical protein
MEQQATIVDLLRTDYGRLRHLVSQAEAAESAPARQELVEALTIELMQHLIAEEQVLDPAVQARLPDSDPLVEARRAEQLDVQRTLKRLELLPPGHAELASLLRMLAADLGHRAEVIDADVLPLLMAGCSVEQLANLATQFEAAKHGAPTHPHPDGPDPADHGRTALIGLVDRIRDTLTGRK